MLADHESNLDTICYRGSASLAHLALISQADVFDQVNNPDGLQRDLSPKHASDAYEYARREQDPEYPRAFPEVVLNVRDKKVLNLEETASDNGVRSFRLSFDLDKMRDGKVAVSRVDGNHRLYYAAGDDRRDPLMVSAPFQIHVGLNRDEERSLFVDINANQKGLNTSHLAIMRARLTAEEQEIKDHPDRWIANRLAEDPDSAWHGLVPSAAPRALSVFALELAERLRHGRMRTRRRHAVSSPSPNASRPLSISTESHSQCAASMMPRPDAGAWSPPTRYRVRSAS